MRRNAGKSVRNGSQKPKRKKQRNQFIRNVRTIGYLISKIFDKGSKRRTLGYNLNRHWVLSYMLGITSYLSFIEVVLNVC